MISAPVLRWLWITLLITTGAAASAEDVPAQLAWDRHLVLSTPATGRVEQVAVKVGERVRAGQELLRLDSAAEAAERAEADAALAEAGLLLAEAKRERERTQELYDRTLLADHDLQLAEITLARARTAEHAARTRLAHARRALDYRILTAPWDGQVVAVHVQPGQTVVNRDRALPLLELAGEDRLVALARVDAARLAGLTEGAEVTVQAGGRRITGVVQSLVWEAAQEDAPYRLAVGFRAAGAAELRPGMPATLELP